MACRQPPTRSQYCNKAKAKKRRKRHAGRTKKKSCRPGKVTRNPFFNYLRWFRKKHCGWSMIKVAVEGAKCWCKMSDQQRQKFYKEACGAPKFRRRAKSRGRSRGRSSGRSICGGGRRGKSKRSRGRRKRSGRRRSRHRAHGGPKKSRRSRRRSSGRKPKGGCGACRQARRVKSVC